MKTQINGVEITPQMAGVFKEWYDQSVVENTQPYIYTRWLSQIQDFLTRILIDMDDDDEDVSKAKNCLEKTIQIKDDFEKLIPEKDEQ